MILKNFIVFEGIDGAGTSTQINILKKSPLADKFFFTTEPTDSPTGKFLRSMLKGDVKLNPKTSAYLFAADRCEHLWGTSGTNCGIEQKCNEGKIVISDRYLFSSLAYQSVTCGDILPRKLNDFFPLPQLLFFFEIEPEISLTRIKQRETKEIYETVEFLKSTEERYKKIIEEYENLETAKEMKIIRIDASQKKEKIADLIWNEISTIL